MKIFNLFILLVVLLTQLINSMTLRDKILEPYLDGPKKELFKVYHQIYNKKYDLNSEEGIRRYRIFKDNLKYIKQENAKGHSHKLGITPFADMTDEEYIEKTARPVELMKEEIKEMSNNSSPFLSKDENLYAQGYTSVDWTNYISGVKNEGGCSASWAFSGISAIESNYKILTGKSVRLSTQQSLDCNLRTSGCNGGNSYVGLEFLRISGASLEDDYPYTAKQGTCKYDSAKALNIVNKNIYCQSCTMENWVSLLKQGPMVVLIDSTNTDFKLYKSGIIDLINCKGGVNHSVVAVALLNGDGFDYIKILNSWSEDWGDHGYMYVKYNPGYNNCYITNSGYLPIINADPTPLVVSKPSFYSQCDYLGWRLSSDISVNYLWTDKISLEKNVNSIKTFEYDVTLYDDIDCKGKAFKFNGDEKCFSTSLNPDAKLSIGKSRSASIVHPTNKPKNGCINLFRLMCFTGNKQEICNDTAVLNLDFDFVQSILLGAEVKKVIIFTGYAYKGISYEFSSSSASLTLDIIRNIFGKARSVKILK